MMKALRSMPVTHGRTEAMESINQTIATSDLHMHCIRCVRRIQLLFVGSHPRLQRGLENLEGVLAIALEALLSSLPVNDLPDVLHIGSFAVEILCESFG